jgi:putative FmdB family regulatory protein
VPTYQYACTACGHQLEAAQSFADEPLTECPVCEGRLRKLFSSVGIVFKGSGFYRTDSRAGAGGSASEPAKPSESKTSESAKSDSGKSDSGKSESGKSGSGKSDSGNSGSGKSESGRSESSKSSAPAQGPSTSSASSKSSAGSSSS